MRTKVKFRSPMYGLLCIAATLMFGGISPSVYAQSKATQDCIAEWAGAPAQSYCSGVVFAAIETQSDADALGTMLGHCLVGSGTCSITANVGSDTAVSTTWTPTTGDIYVAPANVDTIDICFSRSGSSYTATVKVGCDVDETTSADATTNGLPLP